jgi:hypothetical protein
MPLFTHATQSRSRLHMPRFACHRRSRHHTSQHITTRHNISQRSSLPGPRISVCHRMTSTMPSCTTGTDSRHDTFPLLLLLLLFLVLSVSCSSLSFWSFLLASCAQRSDIFCRPCWRRRKGPTCRSLSYWCDDALVHL